jgi:outer membrane protein assembly factor BamB
MRRERFIGGSIVTTCVAFVLGLSSATVWSADPAPGPGAAKSTWAQWRGPSRDGLLPAGDEAGPAWPQSLQGDALTTKWRVDLGPSYSGPIVSATMVFTTETADKKQEAVRAYDRATGKEVWSRVWDGSLSVPFFAKENGDWIRSTPCLDVDADGTERLYVGGIRDRIVCLNAADGSELWSVDCVERFKSPVPAFGCVCSPLVVGEAVYMQAGAAFLKLNKRTGETLWRVLDDGGGMGGSAFSSPVLAAVGGRTQLLVQTRNDLAGVDPETGTVLWKQKVEAFRGMNILTPVVFKDAIFTSAYGGKAQLWKPLLGEAEAPGKAEPLWTKKTEAYMSSPVIVGRYAYVHLRSRRVACVDLTTGEETWRTEPFGRYWSMVARGDRILGLDERGDLYLIAADPKAFTVLDKRKVSEAETWAYLAVAGDELFIRELKSLVAWKWK